MWRFIEHGIIAPEFGTPYLQMTKSDVERSANRSTAFSSSYSKMLMPTSSVRNSELKRRASTMSKYVRASDRRDKH